jgi:hypothetical protein
MTINNYIPALVSNGSTNHLDVINSHSYTSEASSPITGTSLQKWNTEGGPSGAFTTTWYSSGAANEGFTWANKLGVPLLAGVPGREHGVGPAPGRHARRHHGHAFGHLLGLCHVVAAHTPGCLPCGDVGFHD